MNKHNALLFLPLVQALADGKIIQKRVSDTEIWVDLPCDRHVSFGGDIRYYRIKPEPPKELTLWYSPTAADGVRSYYPVSYAYDGLASNWKAAGYESITLVEKQEA